MAWPTSWTSIATILHLALSAYTATVPIELNIQNAKVSPDGFTRSAVVANGQFPGPLISGFKGDRFNINVVDGLTDTTMLRGTTIHWHGIFQNHSADMDGPSGVTQCPIVPNVKNNFFLYNFTVGEQTGTYWYHSHYSTQYCDGLRGPLVIYDRDDPLKELYDVDDASTVITLGDWYHKVAPEALPKPNIDAPNPDSTVINGLGRYLENQTTPLAVVRAQPGKRHRFRLINTGCNPSFVFQIESHNLTVIEADGVETDPVNVDALEIFPGQRYSVVVTMDRPISNYWIRAQPSTFNTSLDPFAGAMNSAILRYDNAPKSEPPFRPPPSKKTVVLNEAQLHPFVSPGSPCQNGTRYPPPPGKACLADKTIHIAQDITKDESRYLLNNASWSTPKMPALLQILSGATNASELLPPGSYYNLPLNSTIEITFQGGFEHPFHLHGHNFDVVRVSGNSTYNYKNPVRRDTVSIGEEGDLVTVRFITDNAGPWFLHCHIDWHLMSGMAVVLVEGGDEIKKNYNPNPDWEALCPTYYANNPDTKFSSIT